MGEITVGQYYLYPDDGEIIRIDSIDGKTLSCTTIEFPEMEYLIDDEEPGVVEYTETLEASTML
jgi:hypothetical protein